MADTEIRLIIFFLYIILIIFKPKMEKLYTVTKNKTKS